MSPLFFGLAGSRLGSVPGDSPQALVENLVILTGDAQFSQYGYTPCGKRILQRIRQGALESRQTPDKIKDLIRGTAG